MTLEQLKEQYHLHGSTHFRRHYGVSQYKVYAALWYQPAWNWWKKEKIPDDRLSPKERRELFYRVTDQDIHIANKSIKDEVYKDTIRKVERFKEEYVKPEPYVWPFAQFMNRF